MFELAITFGFFAHLIFFLGIFGLLYKNIVFVVTSCVIIFLFFRFRIRTLQIVRRTMKTKNVNKLMLLLVIIFISQIFINVIGALAPELSFDALWYHLSLPKLYLLHHSIFYISGGLLYYSAMPKLGELLYVGALSLGSDTVVKLLHLLFGLLTCIAIYKIARTFASSIIAFIAVIIFYSNLVVAWESTVAYVDLIRAFYEIMALWGFINWYRYKKRKWLMYSSIMVGLAITTKLLALGSLFIFAALINYVLFEKRYKIVRKEIQDLAYYVVIALVIPLPWFIFSYWHTGNPVYPFFSDIYKVTPEPVSIMSFFTEVWNIFMRASDPISPIYMIFLPLIIMSFSKFSKEVKLIALYSLLAVIVWYFTPRTGGGRFLLPYLPAFSLVCAAVLSNILKKVRMSSNRLFQFLVVLIIITSIISIGYRFAASIMFVPVVFGLETKQEFLSRNLNFAFGDFYDTDLYFSQHIKPSDRVLLYGFHNLYYVNFPYIHASWVKKGDQFNYIATQGVDVPSKYSDWQLIYTNARTAVKLYRSPEGRCGNLCTY